MPLAGSAAAGAIKTQSWKCFICLYATVSFPVLLDCVANAREHKTWTAASIGSVSNDWCVCTSQFR